MSDPRDIVQRQRDLDRRMGQTEVTERAFTGYGATFPTAPATGRTFFRTDLGWLCYYDGTRWLTAHEYAMVLSAFVSYGTTSPQTTNLQDVRFDYAPYITRVTIHTRVSTTNNATNFWSIAIQGINGAVTLSDTIATTDTSANSVASINRVDGAASTAAPTNRDWFRVQLTKTLTPGAIEMAAQMNYRLIIP
jgi:hypothetical protein